MANLKRIKDLCSEKKVSFSELCSAINIGESGLYRMIQANSTKIETLEQIAKFFDVPISYFFDDEKGNDEYDVLIDFFRISNDTTLYSDYLMRIYEYTIASDKDFRSLVKEVFTPEKLKALKYIDISELKFIQTFETKYLARFFDDLFSQLKADEKGLFHPCFENIKKSFFENVLKDKLIVILKKENVLDELSTIIVINDFLDFYSFLPKEKESRKRK